jgi:hypothetical protein
MPDDHLLRLRLAQFKGRALRRPPRWGEEVEAEVEGQLGVAAVAMTQDDAPPVEAHLCVKG